MVLKLTYTKRPLFVEFLDPAAIAGVAPLKHHRAGSDKMNLHQYVAFHTNSSKSDEGMNQELLKHSVQIDI